MTREGYVKWEIENIIHKAFLAGVQYSINAIKSKESISVKDAVDNFVSSYWTEETEIIRDNNKEKEEG